MTESILAEDFIALCFLLSGVDPKMPLIEVARRAERYQKEHGIRYLVDEGDFEEAFMELLLWNCEFPSSEDRRNAISTITLLEAVPLILQYRELYVNDSDAAWISPGSAMEPVTEEHERMDAFFGKWRSREEIIRFLAENGWDESMLDPKTLNEKEERRRHWLIAPE